MSAENYLLPLQESATAGPDQVGGKALGLGKLLAFGLPVPPGFVVTADAYRACVREAGISTQIADAVATATNAKKAWSASETIGRLFNDHVLIDALADDIERHYQSMGDIADCPVAVRSSATAEDLADASFAGQQDTYLWICGADDVKRHIVRCWGSLFTPRAIQYRARLAVVSEDLAMAVVVQQMVPAAAAGVLMTLEPVTGDRDVIYLEGTYGLGEGVVRGDVGVDRYWVAKASTRLHRSEIATKARAHRVDTDSAVVQLQDVDEQLQNEPCLNEPEVLELAALGQRVEKAFGAPMDIEWAMDDARRVYLVRPDRRQCGVVGLRRRRTRRRQLLRRWNRRCRRYSPRAGTHCTIAVPPMPTGRRPTSARRCPACSHHCPGRCGGQPVPLWRNWLMPSGRSVSPNVAN